MVPAAAREEAQEEGLCAHVVRIRRLPGVLRRVRPSCQAGHVPPTKKHGDTLPEPVHGSAL